jgi:hypothetical protein
VERSASDVTGVQAARESGIGGPFNNCPAVGEQSHLVWLFPELQDEVSVADGTVRLKAPAQITEINRTMMLMDLHRVPAAKSNVGTTGPGQMNKVSCAASLAIRAKITSRDL